jgi:hypothetical protein
MRTRPESKRFLDVVPYGVGDTPLTAHQIARLAAFPTAVPPVSELTAEFQIFTMSLTGDSGAILLCCAADAP